MELKPFIEGKTVDLRPLSLEDVSDTYVGWLNDAEVCEFNSHHVYPNTHELAVEYVTRVRSQKDDLVLAVIAKDTKKHIGNISLQNINPVNRSAEFAILMGDKGSWGKGIGTEAAKLIVKHGFEQLNLHRIYCGTSEENIAMQKLAIALGFQQEGVRKDGMYKNGAFRDIIEYGLLRKDHNGTD